MDVSNDTPYDVRYKVAGGGAPIGPHGKFIPAEDTSQWPVIAAGAVVNLRLTTKGPWRVYFCVNGEGFIADASSDNDLVRLAPSGDTFQANARRVPRATSRPANLAGHA